MKHLSVNLSSQVSFESPLESYKDNKTDEIKNKFVTMTSQMQILDLYKKSDKRQPSPTVKLFSPGALKSDRV